MKLRRTHIPGLVLTGTILLLTGGIIYIVSDNNVNNKTAPSSVVSVKQRDTSELSSVITATYSELNRQAFVIADVYHTQVHWYVVTAHVGPDAIPYKYIVYDNRPVSDRLVVTGTGISHPDLPAASEIPADILDRVIDKGY